MLLVEHNSKKVFTSALPLAYFNMPFVGWKVADREDRARTTGDRNEDTGSWERAWYNGETHEVSSQSFTVGSQS